MRSEGASAEVAAPGWRVPAARVLGWAVLAGLLAVQVWALYVAGGTGAPLFPHADKVGHLALFALPAAVAGLLGSRAAVGLLLVHALVAEPVQAWVTVDRVTDAWDAVANVVGLAVGAGWTLRPGRRR